MIPRKSSHSEIASPTFKEFNSLNQQKVNSFSTMQSPQSEEQTATATHTGHFAKLSDMSPDKNSGQVSESDIRKSNGSSISINSNDSVDLDIKLTNKMKISQTNEQQQEQPTHDPTLFVRDNTMLDRALITTNMGGQKQTAVRDSIAITRQSVLDLMQLKGFRTSRVYTMPL